MKGSSSGVLKFVAECCPSDENFHQLINDN